MEVRMTAESMADFRRLPLTIRARVVELLRRLAEWPNVSGAKPLRKEWKGHFRFCTGDWRIIVRPAGAILWIVRIDNRRDVYGD